MIVRARRIAAAGDLPRGRAEDADAGQLPRGGPDRDLRLLLRHRLVAHHRAHRLLVQPDLGHDDRHADPDLHDLRRARLDRRLLRAGRALRRRRHLHRRGAGRRHVAGPEDRLPGRRDADLPADRAAHRRRHLGAGHRPDDALPAQGDDHRLAGAAGAAGDADVARSSRDCSAGTCRGGWCWSACSSRSRSSCAASIRCRSRSAPTCRSPPPRRSSPAAWCAGSSSARPAWRRNRKSARARSSARA